MVHKIKFDLCMVLNIDLLSNLLNIKKTGKTISGIV